MVRASFVFPLVLTLLTLLPRLSGQETKPSNNETAPPAAADPAVEQAIQDLGEVVVTPNRGAARLFDVPGSVAVVGEAQLSTDRAPSTFPDALREIPGVMIQKTSPGGGSPFIRGFTGFRTLILVDGVRINNSVFREGPNQYSATIDSLSLDRAEVVKGPGSVLYGSDAAGGTINAITEDVDLGSAGGWDIGGRAYYRFNSAEASHVTHESLHGGWDGRFGFNIGGTYRSYGDTDAGGDFGRQKGLGYDAYAVDAKMRAVIDEHIEMEFLFQRVFNDNVPRQHSTSDSMSFHGTTVGTDRRRDTDNIRDLAVLTTRFLEGPFFERAELKLVYQSQDEVQDRIRSNGRRDKSGFDVDTLGILLQFESKTAIGRLTYGVDVYHDQVDSFANSLSTGGVLTRSEVGPVADNADYLTVGVYVQDQIELGEWGEWTIGLRFNHAAADADQVADPIGGGITSLEDDWQAVVGSTELLVHVTSDLNMYGRVGVGFRAPNLSDLTRFDSARSGEFEIPSPGLDPEYFVGLEYGLKYRTEYLRAEAAYFYTFIIDGLARRPTGMVTANNEPIVTRTNVGDGFVHGVEFAAAWDFLDEFTLSGQFTFQEGLQDVFPTAAPTIDEEPLSRVSPIYGRLALLWRPSDTGFRAEFSMEIAGKADRLNTGDKADTQRIPPGGTPGYAIFNLRFGYQATEELDLFLHLENLADHNYRIHGSGSNEAGFAVVAGFDLRF